MVFEKGLSGVDFMLEMKRSYFLLMTLLLCSFSVQANLERYVKRPIDLIVWVNVMDEDTGVTIDFFKHATQQSRWRRSGDEDIKKILQQKYNTSKYSHRVVLPGVCYLYYTNTNDEGDKSHYLSTGGNLAAKLTQAGTVRQDGGQVEDIGCVKNK